VAAVTVIAIDGPSGSGKGTVATMLADRLGFHYLDSGALYRALALLALERGIELDDDAALVELAQGFEIEFVPDPRPREPARVLLNGRNVNDALRNETTGDAASRIARRPAVRTALLARQRACARPPGLVADGRDMGTVVFANAACKFYITASPEARAARRYKQLKQKGISVSLRDLAREVAERDRRDTHRPVAPLRPAEDARIIDSTDLSAAEVLARMLSLLERHGIAPVS
jgi:CMP/dCMP kinase